MFARAATKKSSSSHISNDVADLINEIEHIATAPFDESIVVTKDPADETALLVDNHATTIDKDEDEVERSGNVSPDDLSVQVSELSTGSLFELAFLHKSMNEHDVKDEPPADDIAPAKDPLPIFDVARDVEEAKDTPIATASTPPRQEEVNAPPSQEEPIGDSKMEEKEEPHPVDKTFMRKLWSSISNGKKIQDEPPFEDTKPAALSTDKAVVESPQDVAPVVKDDEAEKSVSPSPDTEDADQFNPFVNIGNRLLDNDAEEDNVDDDSYQHIMSTIGKVLQGMTWALGICAQWLLVAMAMIAKVTIWLLGICAGNVKLSGGILVVLATGMYLKSAFAPFSVTISVQPSTSAWNASMMQDLTPPPEIVQEIVFSETFETDVESALADWIALLKVLVVSLTVGLTGFSILGMQTSSSSNNGNQVSTYCKHEDDCSRYANLNIKQLKKALRARKLATTGNHSHLVDRLVANDNGGALATAENSEQGFDIDVSVVNRNTTIKILQSKLRSRELPVTGIKEDLITKVWIPARVEELKLNNMEELRELLETKKLSKHGKSKDELIRRLIEAGH